MTKFQTIILAIAAFVVAGLLYKFVPGTPELAMGAAALASALAGWAKQHPEDAKSVPDAKAPQIQPPAAIAVLMCISAFPVSACHNVKPDAFAGAVVDCAKVNPEASAALAQVETCLLGVATQNYGACLAGLVTEAHFTVDEITCLVAWVAQQKTAKVGASTASLDDLRVRQNAVDWLARENISIRNSYPSGQ